MVPATHSNNHIKISACGGAFIKYTTKIKSLAKTILKDIDNKNFENSEYSITLAKIKKDYSSDTIRRGIRAYARSAEALQDANIYELSAATQLMKKHPLCNNELKHKLESNFQIFYPYLDKELQMVAETESIEIGSDDEFESDTDEEKMRNIFNTSSQEIENTASEEKGEDFSVSITTDNEIQNNNKNDEKKKKKADETLDRSDNDDKNEKNKKKKRKYDGHTDESDDEKNNKKKKGKKADELAVNSRKQIKNHSISGSDISDDLDNDEDELAIESVHIGGPENGYISKPHIEFSSPIPNTPLFCGCGRRPDTKPKKRVSKTLKYSQRKLQRKIEAQRDKVHDRCYIAFQGSGADTESGFTYVNFTFTKQVSVFDYVPKVAFSMIYVYLLQNKHIPLPKADDKLLADDSQELENIYSRIISIMEKEKPMLKSLINTSIEELIGKEQKIIHEEEKKKQHASEQKIKISRAVNLVKKSLNQLK